jgi:hypothetical protein
MACIPQSFEQMLHNGIKTEVERIVNEEAVKAAERVEVRVKGLVDSVALGISSRYSVERPFANELVIRVHQTKPNQTYDLLLITCRLRLSTCRGNAHYHSLRYRRQPDRANQ